MITSSRLKSGLILDMIGSIMITFSDCKHLEGAFHEGGRQKIEYNEERIYWSQFLQKNHRNRVVEGFLATHGDLHR
jgi:hypothetical protein